MSILDLYLLCSDDQAIGTGTTAVVSTNSVPVSAALRKGWDRGEPLWPYAVITNQPAGSGYTCKCEIIQADNTDFSTNKEVLAASDAIPVASIKPGYMFKLGPLAPGRVTRDHVGFQFTQGGTPSTGATVTAGFALDRPTHPDQI